MGLLLAAFTAVGAQKPLEVYFINVDQGDATLILSPSGQSLLIDGGDNGKGLGVVVPLLRGLKLSGLTYLVATHYHADHIGGLDEVVASGFLPQVAAYDRGTFGSVPSTASYRGYVQAVSGVRRTIAPGTKIDLSSGVTVECLVVNGMVKNGPSVPITGSGDFENAASVGLKVRFGSFDLWVGGDLTGGGKNSPDVESPLARVAGDFDVIHVNHNGSDTSTRLPFLCGLSPEVAIISCGVANPYGHPHTEVLTRLSRMPTMQVIYQTTEGSRKPGGVWARGTIRVRALGNSYTVDGGVLTPRTFPVDETLSPPPHPHAARDLVIAEYLANPARVSDEVGEYVEIRNTTRRSLDLIGLTLRDEGIDSVRFETSVPVAAGDSVVVGRHADPRQNGGLVPDRVVSGFFLSNSADEIRLDDPWGQALDVVRYSGASLPVLNGVAYERRLLGGPGQASNFAAATIPFGRGDRGTPGRPNAADPSFAAHLAITAGLPVPGQALTLRLAGPAGRMHMVVMSTSRSSILLPGPVTLGVGLDLLVFSFLFPNWIGSLGTGVTTAGLTIPDVPALTGQTFYLQLVVIGAGGLPETVSDVVRLTIG